MMKSYMKIGLIASVALIMVVLLAGMISAASIRVITAGAGISDFDGSAEADFDTDGGLDSWDSGSSTAKANLTISEKDVTFVPVPQLGKTVTVYAKVTNDGTANILGSFNIRFLITTNIEFSGGSIGDITSMLPTDISDSNPFDGDPEFSGLTQTVDRPIVGLGIGKSATVSACYTVDSDKIITVIADSKNQISESNEGDNVVVVEANAGSGNTTHDASIRSTSVPSKAYANDNINLRIILNSNFDYKDAPVGIYVDNQLVKTGKVLLEDGVFKWDPNDPQAPPATIPYADGEIQISDSIKIESMVSAGTVQNMADMPYTYNGARPNFEYYNYLATSIQIADAGSHTITIILDPDNKIAESNKMNNTSISMITIEENPEDDDTNKAPVANAGADITAKVDEVITLSGTGSDSDGTIAKYEWDFRSDGTYDWSSSVAGTTTTMYGAISAYTATLRVTDNDGATATDTVKITIIAGSTGGSGGGGSGTWSWDYSNIDNSGTPNENPASNEQVMTIIPSAEYSECSSNAECGDGYVCAYNTCQPVLPSVTAEEATTTEGETETAAAGPLTGLFLAANSDAGFGLLVLLLLITGGIAFYLVGRFMTSEKGSKDYRKEKEPFIVALVAIALPAITMAISGASTAYMLLIAEAAALAIFFVKYETQYGYMLSRDAFRLQKLKELVTETKADKESE